MGLDFYDRNTTTQNEKAFQELRAQGKKTIKFDPVLAQYSLFLVGRIPPLRLTLLPCGSRLILQKVCFNVSSICKSNGVAKMHIWLQP